MKTLLHVSVAGDIMVNVASIVDVNNACIFTVTSNTFLINS